MSHPPHPAHAILDHWFGAVGDTTPLDREQEPFRTVFGRWYGKDPVVDADIRARFEGELHAVAAAPQGWSAELARWASVPDGLVALVVLLDQLPRNMYRDTPRMYAYDPLALLASQRALREAAGADLPVLRRMFLWMPWMHAESLTLQEECVRGFQALVDEARRRAPAQVPFVTYALDYAHQHRDVVARYGRFPHRNRILGRADHPDEVAYLAQPGAGF